jgi:disulfide oxidoreductase YuzD
LEPVLDSQVTRVIRIEVYDDSRKAGCLTGGWGPRWSQEEITLFVAQHLRRKYGATVEVSYVDLARPERSGADPEIVRDLETTMRPLPAVVIDGKIRFAGYVDYWSIAEVVEESRKGLEPEAWR